MAKVKLEQLETINLLDLSDISFSSPLANDDVLVYNSFSGNWENNISIGDYLPLAGGTMSGDIDMDGNAIIFSTGDQIQVDGSGALELSSDKGVICRSGATASMLISGTQFAYINTDSEEIIFNPATPSGLARIYATDDGTAFIGSIAWPLIMTGSQQWNLPDETGIVLVGEGWNTIIANAGASEDGKVIAWDDGSSEYTLVAQSGGGGSQDLQSVMDIGSTATGLPGSVEIDTSADVNISATSGMITLDAMDINVGNTGSVTNTYVKANDLVEIESSIAVNIIAAGQLDIQSAAADVLMSALGDIRFSGLGNIGSPLTGHVLTAASSGGELRWSAPTGGGSNFGTVYFVAPTGNDGTATVGDLTLPWQTIAAAVDQAVIDALTNPLIYVFPGTYTDASIQFEGGTFFFTPGVLLTGPPQYHGTTGLVNVNQGTKTFTTPGNFETHFNVVGKKIQILGSTGNDGIYTVVSAVNNAANTDIIVVEVIPDATVNGRLTDALPIFSVGTPTTPILYGHIANNLRVFGEADVNIPASIDNDWSGGFASSYLGGDIYLEMHSVTIEQGVGVSLYNNGKMTLTGEYFNVTVSGYAITIRDESDSVFNFQRIICTGSVAFFIRHGDSPTYTGTCRIEVEEIQCLGITQPFAFFIFFDGARVFIECTDIHQTGTGYAINNNNHFGGEIKIVGNVTSTLAILNSGTNGYLRLEGDLIATANSTSFNSISGGSVYINGDIYHNSTPTAITQMVSVSGGTLRLDGKIQTTTTGGYGIAKSGGTLVLDTVKIISDSDSINALTAQDVKVIHSLAVTTAVNGNISNIIVGSGIITDVGIE